MLSSHVSALISCQRITSQRGDTLADKAARYALSQLEEEFDLQDFHPTGSDERQYCSPGFDLPVGSYIRGRYKQYEEYHTSLDNKSLLDFPSLHSSLDAMETICRTLDMNRQYRNLSPFGEPNLGRRGLYPTTGGRRANMDITQRAHATLWLCNQSNGERDLIDIAERRCRCRDCRDLRVARPVQPVDQGET